MNIKIRLIFFTVWGLIGCEPRDKIPLPPEMKTKIISSTYQDVTIKGEIKAKSQIKEFLGVDASVVLEELRDNQVYVVASTVANPNYDNGFSTTFELTYNTQRIKKDARYYLRVTAQRGDTVWKNNIMTSAILDPYQDNTVEVFILAAPLHYNLNEE